MARMYFLHGLTVVGVISNPANSTLSSAKWNFSGLRVTPLVAQMWSHSTAWEYASEMESDHNRVSSMHFVFLLMWDTMPSYLLVYPSPEAM